MLAEGPTRLKEVPTRLLKGHTILARVIPHQEHRWSYQAHRWSYQDHRYYWLAPTSTGSVSESHNKLTDSNLPGSQTVILQTGPSRLLILDCHSRL